MYPPQDSYPLNYCGRLISDAALEQSRNTDTAEELTGIAAMAAAAGGVHDYCSVQRTDMAPSSVGVLVFVGAESGDGKSTAAKVFVKPFEEMQKQLEMQAQDPHAFVAAQMVWKATLNELDADVRQLIREGQATDQAQAAIARHLSNRPKQQPKVTLLSDRITQTALLRHLAVWPSLLLHSRDGSHLLKEQTGAKLDIMTAAWDGDPLRSEIAKEDYTAHDPRVSALIFVPPEAMWQYFACHGGEAHSTGFFARSEWSVLPPTKGTRVPYLGPKTYEAVTAYQGRVTDLLEECIRKRRAGDNSRHVMGFTPDGTAYFRDLYERTKHMSAPGGAYAGLRGYAAKFAERVARYACVIHVFNDHPGLITAETLWHAEHIQHWHGRQFLNLLTQTSPHTHAMQDAQMLEHYLWQALQRGQAVRTADLQQICPFDWKVARRNRALQVLLEMGRAHVHHWRGTGYARLGPQPQLQPHAGVLPANGPALLGRA